MYFTANRRTTQIGLDELYPGAQNPFPWMSEMLDPRKKRTLKQGLLNIKQAGN